MTELFHFNLGRPTTNLQSSTFMILPSLAEIWIVSLNSSISSHPLQSINWVIPKLRPFGRISILKYTPLPPVRSDFHNHRDTPTQWLQIEIRDVANALVDRHRQQQQHPRVRACVYPGSMYQRIRITQYKRFLVHGSFILQIQLSRSSRMRSLDAFVTSAHIPPKQQTPHTHTDTLEPIQRA